jgi:hypothetical protein
MIEAILISADCISPNTPEAVTINVIMPTIVAIMPDDLIRGTRHGALQYLCGLWPREAAEVRHDRILGRILTEGESCNGNYD